MGRQLFGFWVAAMVAGGEAVVMSTSLDSQLSAVARWMDVTWWNLVRLVAEWCSVAGVCVCVCASSAQAAGGGW